MELIWIIKAEYVLDFKINLEFNNGKVGIVDLKEDMNGPIFEKLKDQSYFKKFKLNSWTIEWPNGADYSPEFLYQLAINKKDKQQRIMNN